LGAASAGVAAVLASEGVVVARECGCQLARRHQPFLPSYGCADVVNIDDKLENAPRIFIARGVIT